MPREIFEVHGPQMAYFEFTAPDHENFRIVYEALRFSFPDPILLARQLHKSLKIIRTELASSDGAGPAIIFWRNEPNYTISPVCYDGTNNPTVMFEARCRLATYPILDKAVWSNANKFSLIEYVIER